jgi:hypothetical protein
VVPSVVIHDVELQYFPPCTLPVPTETLEEHLGMTVRLRAGFCGQGVEDWP